MNTNFKAFFELPGVGSKAEVAKIIDTTPQTLYNLINRKVDPKLSLILGIKKAYPDLNLNWLLAGEGEPWMSKANGLEERVKVLERKLDDICIVIF